MFKFVRVFLGLLFVVFLFQTANAATFVVTKTADTNDGTCDADCSLREAVAAANATADNDIINFSSLFDTAQTITLSGTEIVIAANGTLTVNGPGADKLMISGNNASRIISTSPSVVATISGATFTAGNGVGAANTGRAGAIFNNGGNLTLNNLIVTGNTAANGGGLNNSGAGSVLTINNSIISNNTASGSGGGLQNFSTSTLNLNNTTMSGNISQGTTGGGAAQVNGTAFVTNSTIANNTAPSAGGFQSNGALMVITNSTITGNTSTNNGGGVHRGTTNVNIFFRNTIVAGNNGVSTSPDVTASATISSEGNNIIGNVGTSAGWVASDLQNVNPMLGTFTNNGGFGNTFLPMAGSPAINAGQNCVVDLTCATNNPPFAVTTDQRGVTRPANGTVDIGAVEVAAAAVNVSIGGRVVSDTGTGMPNTLVFMNTPNGSRSTRTNSFGFYSFDNVLTGTSITVGVSSKAFNYATQNVTVSGNVTNLDFLPTIQAVK